MLPHLPPRIKFTKPTAVDARTAFPEAVLITLRFDGACAPNPGPMGIGYTLADENGERPRVLVRVGAQIGEGTNNEAEYHALLAGMRHALRLGFWNLTIRSDSALVVNQMTGAWKVRGATLKRLHEEAKNLARLFTNPLDIRHVYREGNQEADDLSHQLVFEEPELGLPTTAKRGAFERVLLPWQAAAIRVWHLRHHPGAGTLSRVFGASKQLVEAIQYAQTYRDADFSTFGAWMSQVGGQGYSYALQPAELAQPEPTPPAPTLDDCKACHNSGWIIRYYDDPMKEACTVCHRGQAVQAE